MNADYETIVDFGTMVWTMFAVVIHVATIVVQLALIFFLLGTAALAIFASRINSPRLQRIGALQANSPHIGRNAIVRVALAVALALPLAVGAPFAISFVAMLGVIGRLILDELNLATESRSEGRYARHTAIAAAAVLACFMLFEGEDSLALGSDIIVTASGWRMHEVDWQLANDLETPRVGDLAPDFSLQDPSGEVTVRLSDFRGVKPVALVFGSYT